LLLFIALVGCSGTPDRGSRYSMDQDQGPDEAIDLSRIPDAEPRNDRRSRAGNKSPYEVWGKTYRVMASNAGYRERGTASWYGKKFHGHSTSNGEVYDMYAMSGAHKALSLPAYVRVTNLGNGKAVIVRINDRGPFHGDRLIDLSYAAAYKLDMLTHGTAQVEVEAINVPSYLARQRALAPAPSMAAAQGLSQADEAPSGKGVASTVTIAVDRMLDPPAPSTGEMPGQYVQIGAYSSQKSAEDVKLRLAALIKDLAVRINRKDSESPLFRVRMGPLDSDYSLDYLLATLRSAGYSDPLVVDLP
jgi:rare lipoprotein A